MKIFFKNLSLNLILLALVAYFALASQPYVYLNITSKIFSPYLATKLSYVLPFIMEFGATLILIKALVCYAEGSWRVSLFIFVGYAVVSYFNYISSQYGVLEKVKDTVIIVSDDVLDSKIDSLEKKSQAKMNAEANDYQPKSTQNLERQIQALLSEKDVINKETSIRNCPSCVLFHKKQTAKIKVLDEKINRLEKTLFGIQNENKLIAENWQIRKKELNANYNANIKKLEQKHAKNIQKDTEELQEQTHSSQSSHSILYFFLFMLGATKALTEDHVMTAKIEKEISKTAPLKMLGSVKQALLPAPKKVKATPAKAINFESDYLEEVKNDYSILGESDTMATTILLENRALIDPTKKSNLIRYVNSWRAKCLKDPKIIKMIKDDFDAKDLQKIESLLESKTDITQIMAEFHNIEAIKLEILEKIFNAKQC